jgi:hypothetical protein
MSLPAAREAAARGDWDVAYELLVKADTEGLAGPTELPLLAEVAYAAGHLDVAIEAWERTHTLCVQAGDPVRAAGAAVRVAMHLLLDTALMAPVRGRLARAERLLDSLEHETPAHAWLRSCAPTSGCSQATLRGLARGPSARLSSGRA